MISFPYRPNGPLLCDLQGRFRATLKGVKGKEEKRPIYVFGFKNKQMGAKSIDLVECLYYLYREDGSLNEEEVHKTTYRGLLKKIGYVSPEPVVEEKLEVEVIEIPKKKKKKKLKKKGAKK